MSMEELKSVKPDAAEMVQPKMSSAGPEVDELYSEEIKQMRDQIPEELNTVSQYVHAQKNNHEELRTDIIPSQPHTHHNTGYDRNQYYSNEYEAVANNPTNSSGVDSIESRDMNGIESRDLNGIESRDIQLESRDACDDGHVECDSSAFESRYESFDMTRDNNVKHYESDTTRVQESLDSEVTDVKYAADPWSARGRADGDARGYSQDSEHSVPRPTSLSSPVKKKKIHANVADITSGTFDLDLTSGRRSRSSSTSTEGCDTDSHFDLTPAKTPDSITTPEVMAGAGVPWQPERAPVERIPEYSAEEEYADARHWRTVSVAGAQYKIDMKCIEPYKQALSHGGYYGDGFNAMLVFNSCHLPDRRRRDYDYVMDNLFLYLLSTLELLVVEDYMLIYFHGATPTHKVPPLRWLRRCQQALDRRLKKNMRQLLVVHPTIWLKTVILMTKPFVSSKFYDKIVYVRSLEHLAQLVPTEYIFLPNQVKQYDDEKFKTGPKPVTPL